MCGTANLAQSLGATTVVDYAREDFTAQGQRFDLIFEAVAKKKSAAGLRHCDRALVAPGGQRLSVDDGRPKLLAEDLMPLVELAGKGEIRPVIDGCYPLEELAEAHRYVDEGHKRGNIVIAVAQRWKVCPGATCEGGSEVGTPGMRPGTRSGRHNHSWHAHVPQHVRGGGSVAFVAAVSTCGADADGRCRRAVTVEGSVFSQRTSRRGPSDRRNRIER